MLKFDWNILFTLINLIIFYLLMKRFFFKPIMNTMDKRKELIEKQFQDADAANNEALELKKQYEEKIRGIHEESDKIISDARESAKTEYGKIMDKAENDVLKMKENAQKAIDAECENAKRAAKEDIASLAVEAARKVVEANISAQTDSDLFDEFLNESSDD